jgi:hypothetical protein
MAGFVPRESPSPFSWLCFLLRPRSLKPILPGRTPWAYFNRRSPAIARGLSLVAIVVSGLTFAFGEGGSKRVLAGVLFGVGMAIAAVNFLAWLFP